MPFFLALFTFWSLFVGAETVFVQASPGSFNHQALLKLLQDLGRDDVLEFCGTPENTLKRAVEQHGLAFCALENTTIPGNYIPATQEALKHYRIARLIARYTMKIDLALLGHEEAGEEINAIASHPAALQQISHWKQAHPHLIEIPIPEGTSEAAQRLSSGALDKRTAVVGPKELIHLYPHLVILETSIQDSEENATTFILFEPEERPLLP